VVPVCIFGAGKVLPPGRRLLNPGRIKLIVLAPVYPPTEGDRYERVKVLNKKVRQEIEKTLVG
jgi:1-acyl-sn-glycerol-3-phosphate acyltransferase